MNLDSMMNIANFDLGNYLKSSIFGGVGLLVLVAFGLYFFRNPLKSFFGNIFGYRKNIDDYTISIHKNREVIYENETMKLKEGLSLKVAIRLFLISLTLLVSPFLFTILFLVNRYGYINSIMEKIKDFKIFEEYENDTKLDSLLSILNNKSEKINFLVNQFWGACFLFILVGLISNSYYIAIIGLFSGLVVLMASFLTIINIISYRTNYKYLNYYRGLRLLQTSELNGTKSLIFLSILGLASNFTELQGFSVFIWILVLVKFAINFATNSLLNREDYISQQHQMVENRDYMNLQNISSYPNPLSQSRGYKFTTLLQMKFFEMEKKVKGKSLIHLDNYAFFPQMVNRSDLRKNPLLKDKLNNSVQISLNAKDITKQLVVLGGMGSGKTEFINNIVEQVHKSEFKLYQSIIYNDNKGDFKQKFYRADKDYLINLFDEDSSVWCIFSEMKHNIEAGTNFVNNLFQSIAGDDKDFFIGRAKQLTAQWIQEAYFSTSNNIESWEMFFTRIKAYEKELEEKDDKTKSSILQTILIALEILSIMRYQIVIEQRKIFCINEFIYETDTQLFLVNNKQYEAKLTPYLVGLWGAINSAIMSKPDIPEEEENPHLILFVLDEYLNLKLDEATRKSMLTLTRSKGACNIIAGQYLINDEKLIQDLDSSRYALITFSINDDFTLEKVSKKLASAEMLSVTSSPQVQQQQQNGQPDMVGLSALNEIMGSKGKHQDNFTYSLGNTEVIALQQLQSMPKYHHLTFIPSEEVKVLNSEDSLRNFKLLAFGYEDLMKDIAVNNNEFLSRESGILYLGYTPQATLNYNNPHFTQWDMENYYKDSLTSSSKVKLDEQTAFIHYMNIAFSETKENAEKYIIDNGLQHLDIDFVFSEVEENAEKILHLMSKYSEEERYELMDKFFDIPREDLEAKYEFCKAHELIGAILGIFTFSDEFRKLKIGM